MLPVVAFGPSWPHDWLRFVVLLGLYLGFRVVLRRCSSIRAAGTWASSDTVVYLLVPLVVFMLSTYWVLNGSVT